MGSLTPGTTYVYEHVDGVTYARESGAPVNTRVEIGRTIERTAFDRELRETLIWKDIHLAAKTNPTLQAAIDRVKIIYHLSKRNGNSET